MANLQTIFHTIIIFVKIGIVIKENTRSEKLGMGRFEMGSWYYYNT